MAWGVGASIGMTFFYIAIILITMSPKESWFIFSQSWYLIAGIILGFGAQVGLWFFVKHNGVMNGGGAIPGASGAISGTAMVACCAHHMADFLPILGISGAAIFLTQYQKPLLVLGLSINLFGIAYMINILLKQQKLNERLIINSYNN